MVLKIAHAAVTSILTPNHYTHVVLALVAIYTLYTYSQGRKTTRERDLHGRTIILTGAFTPIGLTLLDALARRGAHIIALSDTPIDTGLPHLLIPILRTTHNNELIYAEHVDLSSPSSIKKFCDGFVKTENQRVDAAIFGHEYAVRGGKEAEREREAASASTFLFVTLFLPLLLVAPPERDIRLITLVNPFYAAAAPRFTALPPSTTPSPSSSPTSPLKKPKNEGLLAAEGRRALRTIVLTRHLQRVLDALPNNKQVPRTDGGNVTTVVSGKKQRSNIVAVSVSPGVSRTDVVAPLLGAESLVRPRSWRGLILYILFNPIIRILTKSPASALESVLHALFLPTPFKLAQSDAVERESQNAGEGGTTTPGPRRAPDEIEVLKPGALYAECAVAPLRVPPAPPPPETDGGEKEKAKVEKDAKEEDDGELGGIGLGTAVWEEYEGLLKEWERRSKEEEEKLERERIEREKEERERVERATRRPSTPPTVDPDATTSA